MLQFSEVPVANGLQFINYGFGNQCSLCGNYFDEGNICNNGHQRNQIYYLPPGEPSSPKTEPELTLVKGEMVTCGVFNGCRCNICGGFFGDSTIDDICPNGHQIGQQYSR